MLQLVDLTPEAALKYTVSFKARVNEGSLLCIVGYRSLYDLKDKSITSKPLPKTKDWQEVNFSFEIKAGSEVGSLKVTFLAGGKNAGGNCESSGCLCGY